jgi:hypothetical protein
VERNRVRTHRTSLNLPIDLLQKAKAQLGTTSPTEAVTAALEEFVARRQIEALLAMELPDLTLEAVQEMRQPRRLLDAEDALEDNDGRAG